MEYISLLVQLLLLMVVGFCVRTIREMPTTIRELMLEKEKYQNQSNIQRDAYFRDISGKDVQNLLEEWMDYMTDMENKVKKMETPKGKQNFIKLQSKTLMYGSEKTARILAKMMQHFYKPNL